MVKRFSGTIRRLAAFRINLITTFSVSKVEHHGTIKELKENERMLKMLLTLKNLNIQNWLR